MKDTAHYLRSTKGATIIETIVALALAAIILGSITTLAANSLASSSESKMRTEATHYGEEGLEIVRSIRDSQGFATFYSNYANGTTYYLAQDATKGYILTTTASLDYLSQTLKLPFTRTVVITDPGSTRNSVLVQVTVGWKARGHADSVVEDTNLTNWAYN